MKGRKQITLNSLLLSLIFPLPVLHQTSKMNPEFQVVLSQFFIHMVISKFHQRSAIDPSFICYLFCTLAPKDTHTLKTRQSRFKLGTDKRDVQSHSHTKCAFQNTFLTVTKINALDVNESIETEGRQLPAAEQLHQLFLPLRYSFL